MGIVYVYIAAVASVPLLVYALIKKPKPEAERQTRNKQQ
jgi:hypothetical protein